LKGRKKYARTSTLCVERLLPSPWANFSVGRKGKRAKTNPHNYYQKSSPSPCSRVKKKKTKGNRGGGGEGSPALPYAGEGGRPPSKE